MGGEDPDCRRTMIWNKNQQNIDLLNFYKKIIKLRRESLALRRGNFKCLYQQGVALNNSDKNEEIKILLPEIETGKRLKVKDIFNSTIGSFVIEQDELSIKVPAYNFKILSI